MKKLMKLSVILLVLTLFVTQTGVIRNFFMPKQAYAVGDLNVNWSVPEGQPIFVVNNFVPGQSEFRTVTVTNGASNTRPVGIKGLNLTQTKNLATVLDFKITQNGTDRYGGTLGNKTLTDFLAESASPDGIFLSNLAPGATTTYIFSVTFQSSAGNDYQNANAEFDLQVGISVAIPTACSDIRFTNQTAIFGTQSNDKISGTSGNDLIYALEGADKVDGKGGNDCIVGGAGNDSLGGGLGKDTLFGDAGNDTLTGGNENDRLYGGSESDTLDGGNGMDQLYGENGNDKLDGGNENDVLSGGDGADTLEGGNGQDNLAGDNNDDKLDGGTGNDILTGGNGIDTLDGKLGKDTCSGESIKNCEL